MNKPNSKTYDAVIIGSGPGGASVARELSKKKKRVLILERGKNPEIKGSLLQTLPTIRPFKTTDNSVIMTQSVAGGATFSFCGVAMEPPYKMFSKHGIVLQKDIEDTKKELKIAELPDRLIGPMTWRIMNSAQDLGIPWQKLPKFINSSRCRPGCWRCTYNCPYGAKWTAREFAVEAADNCGDFKTGANVETILTENGKAAGVLYNEKGKKIKAEAPCVIVSAGGMYSPVILKNADIKGTGLNFFVDPLIIVTGIAGNARCGLREIPMSTGIDYSGEGYLLTDFTPTALRYMGSALQAGRLLSIFSGKKALSIMIKIRDELSGSLPEKGPVNKELGETEKKRFKSGIEIAEKILRNAGVRSTFKTSVVASHPGGTAKIGEIVNSDLKTEIDNLYVCDTSVIPAPWGKPPVLTLIALGKRLARHLVSQKIV